MDQTPDFLVATLGETAATALKKAAERSSSLATVLAPRAILGWITLASQWPFNGEIPGVPGSTLQFAKSEAGLLNGSLSVGDDIYDFVNADVTQLTATLTIALGGHQPIAKNIKDNDLVGLGKSIDLILKSRVASMRKAADKEQGGVAAAPRGPIPPEAPDGQKKMNANQQPKLPSQTKLKVTKSQAESICTTCEAPSFKNGTFTGCYCMRALAKSASSVATADGYDLILGSAWTKGNVRVLMDILG